MQLGIHSSVRRKVLVIVLVTTFVALLVSALALLSYEARGYREFLLSDVTTQADILARTAAPALAFNDRAAATVTLAMMSSRPVVDAAAIYTADGELFATYRRGGYMQPFPRHATPRGPRVDGRAMTVFHPIVENDQLLGTLYMSAKYELADRVVDYLLILGGVMLASLAVAALVSLWLQGSVTGPILAVTNVARRIVGDRDFNLRAAKTTDDEVGTLVDAFNAMLAEVSERQQALEDSNRKLHQESEERKNAEISLRLADKHKDEFLATLAHELRNPLAPMVNAMGLLQSQNATGETRKEARAIIHRQLSHMIRLVDDLLDVSRISNGRIQLHKEVVDLAQVVHHAAESLSPLLKKHRHELRMVLPKERLYVDGDTVRLTQVLGNLLTNAAKYMDDGGLVELTLERDHNDRACIRVRDHGVGIPEDLLTKVFDLFVQAPSALNRAQGGNDRVEQIIQQPRGKLRVSVPLLISQAMLGELAAEFSRRYPEVEFEVIAEDRYVDLVDEGYDVAIRVNPRADATLVGRRIGGDALVVVAPPSIPRPRPARGGTLPQVPAVAMTSTTTARAGSASPPRRTSSRRATVRSRRARSSARGSRRESGPAGRAPRAPG